MPIRKKSGNLSYAPRIFMSTGSQSLNIKIKTTKVLMRKVQKCFYIFPSPANKYLSVTWQSLMKMLHLSSKRWYHGCLKNVHIPKRVLSFYLNLESLPFHDHNQHIIEMFHRWSRLYHIYQPLRSGRIWHKVNF